MNKRCSEFYIGIYSFSRHFYSKQLTHEEYIKQLIINRQINTISACNTKFQSLFRRVQARTVRITLQLFPEYCQDFCVRKRLGRSFHQQGTVNEYVVSKNKMKVILCLSEMIPWIVLSETFKPSWWLKLRCLRLRTEKCPNPLNVVKTLFCGTLYFR